MTGRRAAIENLAVQKVAASRDRATTPVDPASATALAPWGAVQTVPTAVRVSTLRFHPAQQPRDMLDDTIWAALIETGRTDPASVLHALVDVAATRPASRLVLDHVEELVASVRRDGVLVAITVEPHEGVFVVLDGHCRSMAAALAEIETVSVRVEEIGDSADPETELTRLSRRYVLNATQQRLTPIEGMREIVRLVEVAQRVVEAREATEPRDSAPRRRGQRRDGEREAEVRALVLERTGLSVDRYQTLYRLRNLHPDAVEAASAAGAALTENHLAAIVAAPRETHAMLVRLVALENASVRVTRAYSRAASLEGEEFVVERYAEALRQRNATTGSRTGVSWAPLLRPLPDDLPRRASALLAELEALDERHRAARLRVVAHQLSLHEELVRVFREALSRFG